MQLSLGQAAKHLGISKPTLSKAVHSGKLSTTRHEDGSLAIDPAELERYRSANEHRFNKATDAAGRVETPPEQGTLQAENEGLRPQLSTLHELADTMKAQADLWQRQAESAQRQAETDQRPPSPPAEPKRRGWFGWRKAG